MDRAPSRKNFTEQRKPCGKEPAPFAPLLSLLTQRGVEFRCGVFLETRRQYEAPTPTVLHTQIGGHVEEHMEGGGAEHKAGALSSSVKCPAVGRGWSPCTRCFQRH